MPDQPVAVGGRQVRLHELTARPGVHLLLDRDAPAVTAAGADVHLHRLSSSPGTGVAVVRPDGHAGASATRADDPAVAAWLAGIGAPITVEPTGSGATAPEAGPGHPPAEHRSR